MKHDEAVSPVIGVILMVAITVILAAVIAAFVFGMANNVQKPKVVMVTLERTNSSYVVATTHGGNDLSDLQYINWTKDDHSFTLQANLPGGARNMGSTKEIPLKSGEHIIGIARFGDGVDQVIVDTKL